MIVFCGIPQINHYIGDIVNDFDKISILRLGKWFGYGFRFRLGFRFGCRLRRRIRNLRLGNNLRRLWSSNVISRKTIKLLIFINIDLNLINRSALVLRWFSIKNHFFWIISPVVVRKTSLDPNSHPAHIAVAYRFEV